MQKTKQFLTLKKKYLYFEMLINTEYRENCEIFKNIVKPLWREYLALQTKYKFE